VLSFVPIHPHLLYYGMDIFYHRETGKAITAEGNPRAKLLHFADSFTARDCGRNELIYNIWRICDKYAELVTFERSKG